ncbi:hypothetical protein JCM3775_007081 [Rhodotorula graminis]
MAAAAPYDPPPRSRSASRRSSTPSIFDRVREGLVTAEHIADEAGQVAASVGKAARTAQAVEDDLERAYGGDGRRGRASGTRATSTPSARRTYEGETTEGESESEARTGLIPSNVDKTRPTPKVVPYQPASSTTRQRKKPATSSADSVAAFSSTVEATQEAVDDLADDLELIASQRHRLTGLAYERHTKFHKRRPLDPPRTRAVELDEAVKLAALVANAKPDLERAYRDVSALQPRLAALVRATTSSSSSSARPLKRARKAYDTLTRTFAAVLDFVEDRVKEEVRAREDGQAEQALLGRMKDDHPEWERAKLVAQLQRAKKAAGETTLAKVDYSRDPYTARWLLQQPFTGLDGVLQAIDLAENGITKRDDEKTGSWALGSLLSRTFSPTRTGRSSSASRRSSRASKRSRNELEVGKTHRYRSEDKPRGPAGGDSSDGKDLLSGAPSSTTKDGGGDDDSDDSFDASNLPERVPTDDTSGYVESREELIEDAKAQRRTEHFYTPLVIVYWICIALLYIYYLVARLLGFDSPLGNVDLGSTFGNSAWNDTRDGLVLTSTTAAVVVESTSSSETGPRDLTGVPSATGLSEVLDRASSLEALLSSMSGTATASASASAREGTVTAMATMAHGRAEGEDEE